uniref:ADP ribosylation factor like GTPase 4A n=1 Tax=Rhinolophus ferrumequinum TaxID=59479 RepID=A0A671FAX5_RHIFE
MGNHLTDMAPTASFLPHFQALHVVVIGLDSAGKTSLLYRLKFKEFVQSVPTKGFNTEKIRTHDTIALTMVWYDFRLSLPSSRNRGTV